MVSQELPLEQRLFLLLAGDFFISIMFLQEPNLSYYFLFVLWIPGPIPYIVPPHYHCTPSRPSWLLGGTLRLSSLLMPEGVVAPHNPPRCVSTPTSNEEIYLLLDYRPTNGVAHSREFLGSCHPKSTPFTRRARLHVV